MIFRIADPIKEQLCKELESQYLALTTDLWTSNATEAYLTVTAHYIDDNWRMVSRVLQTHEMPERHTGINIASRLQTVAKEWNIPDDHIVAIVHDNAANMTVAVEELGWDDVSCFGHTLQLAINSGLSDSVLTRLAAATRKLVGRFKHSSNAMAALKQKQKQTDVPEHYLIQDVTTRWNSTYQMFERLEEQRWAVYAVLFDDTVSSTGYKHLYLKDDQWVMMGQMVKILKALQVATTELCEAKVVAMSLVYPVVNGLLKKHLITTSGDVPTVKRFKQTVTTEIKRRFNLDGSDIVTKVAILSSALDPRYLQLKFLNEDQRYTVVDRLKQKVKELEADSEDNEDDAEQSHGEDEGVGEQDTSVNTEKPPSALAFLLESDNSDADNLNDAEVQVNRYLTEPPLKCDEPGNCCLDWWKINGGRFPQVAVLARRYLCVPPTSVPAERIFSTAGLVINKQRSSLTPENADMIIFLNKNLSVSRF